MVDSRLDYRLLAQHLTPDSDEYVAVLFPVKTTAELASATDRINTVDKFKGKMVFDTTLGQPVYASAATAAAAWTVIALGQDQEVPASAGITGFAETFGVSVVKAGGIIKTTIIIDLTGLESGAAGDIIGDATPSVSHLGQFTVARNGTLMYGTITCLETPAGGDPDIDFTSADEATGVQDAAISGLSNLVVLLNTGDWTAAVQTPELMSGLPAADQYLYMVDVGGTAVEYTAGRFLLEFYGV